MALWRLERGRRAPHVEAGPHLRSDNVVDASAVELTGADDEMTGDCLGDVVIKTSAGGAR